MKTIWKYPLRLQDTTTVRMPLGSQVLTVQWGEKEQQPCVWAVVNPDERALEEHVFEVRGTGHDVTSFDTTHYLGTFQVPLLGLVFHVFHVSVATAIDLTGEDLGEVLQVTDDQA